MPRVAGLTIAIALVVTARAATGAMSPLVRIGDPSPIGWIFSSLSGVSIDGTGRAVFVAGSSGVFVRRNGVIGQAIGPGTAVGGGRTVIGAGPPAIDGSGCVIARTLVSDGRQAIVRACGSATTVLVRSGDEVAGGTTIRSLGSTVFAVGSETIAFSGILSDGAGALLRRDANGVLAVVRAGQPAPTGGVFTSFRLAGVSGTGRLGFHASVSQGPDGLFAATETSLTSIVRVGQASPSGGAFSSLGGASLNPADQWVFRAALSTGLNGIFRVDASVPNALVTAVVLQGDPVPIPDATFRGFPSSTTPSINASGAIAFRGLLEGIEAGAGVFVIAPGAPLVALATTRRQTAVGLLSQIRDPVIADDGSVALPASVAGGGPGLYTVRNGSLSPLAQFGAQTTHDALDTRFRFGGPGVRATAEDAAFLGDRDGVFRRSATGLIEVVAYTGQRTPLDGLFAALGTPVVDGRGRIVFGGTVHQGSVKEAVFVYGDRGLEVLASPGRRVSGGGRFSDFFPSGIDDLGRAGAGARGVALTAALEASNADEGLFVFKRARARIVAKTGRRVKGGRLAAFGTPALGDRTQLAFVAQVGTERHPAIVTRSGGGLRVVARSGTDTKTRVAGQFGGFSPPAMAAAGAVFRATLGGQVPEGLFLARGRSLAVLAASADVTTAGDRLRSLGDPTVSGNQVYFLARLVGDQGTAGLYRVSAADVPPDAPAAIDPVVRPNDAAPSGLDGVVVRVEQVGIGPNGSAAAVVELHGAPTTSVLAWVVP